jgi:hypothetical protein
MQNDLYAPLARGRLITYAAVAVIVLALGAVALVVVGISVPRVLLATATFGLIMLGAIGGTIWITGGERSPDGVGPANIRLPMRLRKALPYIFAAIICSYLFQLFELIWAKR